MKKAKVKTLGPKEGEYYKEPGSGGDQGVRQGGGSPRKTVRSQRKTDSKIARARELGKGGS